MLPLWADASRILPVAASIPFRLRRLWRGRGSNICPFCGGIHDDREGQPTDVVRVVARRATQLLWHCFTAKHADKLAARSRSGAYINAGGIRPYPHHV